MFDNIPKHLPSIPDNTRVLVEGDHFHVKQLQRFLTLNQKTIGKYLKINIYHSLIYYSRLFSENFAHKIKYLFLKLYRANFYHELVQGLAGSKYFSTCSW